MYAASRKCVYHEEKWFPRRDSREIETSIAYTIESIGSKLAKEWNKIKQLDSRRILRKHQRRGTITKYYIESPIQLN